MSLLEIILLLLSGVMSLCHSDSTSVCSMLQTFNFSSVSSRSTLQFGNVFSGVACLLVHAVFQARESLLEEWERALVTELRAVHATVLMKELCVISSTSVWPSFLFLPACSESQMPSSFLALRSIVGGCMCCCFGAGYPFLSHCL